LYIAEFQANRRAGLSIVSVPSLFVLEFL